ncbi:hypothetical protein [Streptomyces roseochromogenus]|uniref:Uncharacterized protein n=1 Tax=Streptomyces roseochromogenus subsp. oscitans DS 12.976 TaxID=1352936 RepID=V6JLF1_STRRC|nr:hypothetical protein [Streptomyces roseochromogenus]EST20563.1 hypothetical protein M878_39495 [Streptomyces roseochromogenus subsp. oscitans DS 12.976]
MGHPPERQRPRDIRLIGNIRTRQDFGDGTARVVSGGLDPGVSNPDRSDGTTFQDAVWAGAPFRSKEALLAHVGGAVDA